jgi:hypothetical protein
MARVIFAVFRRVGSDPALYSHGFAFVSPYSVTPSWPTTSVGYRSPSRNVSGCELYLKLGYCRFIVRSLQLSVHLHPTFRCREVWAIPNYTVSRRISIVSALKASEVISKGFPIFFPKAEFYRFIYVCSRSGIDNTWLIPRPIKGVYQGWPHRPSRPACVGTQHLGGSSTLLLKMLFV